ncbi:MAG: hypothetical protein V8Q32_04020 [Anaerotignum faecicola]
MAHVTETDEYGTVEIWLLPFFKPAHVNALLREEEALPMRRRQSFCWNERRLIFPSET